MTGRVQRISPRAQLDLEEQATYFAMQADTLKARFLEATIATFALLLQSPELGNPSRLPHLEAGKIRTWAIKDFPNHLVFYREIPTGIEVVRVLHTRRNWPDMIS